MNISLNAQLGGDEANARRRRIDEAIPRRGLRAPASRGYVMITVALAELIHLICTR